jgi:hypothetical protein
VRKLDGYQRGLKEETDGMKEFYASDVYHLLSEVLSHEALAVVLNGYTSVVKSLPDRRIYRRAGLTLSGENHDMNIYFRSLVLPGRMRVEYMDQVPLDRAFLTTRFMVDPAVRYRIDPDGMQQKDLYYVEPYEALLAHIEGYADAPSYFLFFAIGMMNCLVDSGYSLFDVNVDPSSRMFDNPDDMTGPITLSFYSSAAHFRVVQITWDHGVIVSDAPHWD